jgi:putative alpha-1,2-mannosidase
LNYTGFLAPIWGNGTVQEDYDPLSCGGCEWSSITYEGLPIEYSWTIPFDMATLIDFMGGPNTTESRLDTMFIPGLRSGGVGSGGTNGAGTTLFNPGNEPSFGTPFLYNYLQGRQHKSVLRSRETVNTYYSAEANGLPGNSDAGAVDSWLIWNLIGLYPVVTQPVYLILSPWFDDITLDLGDYKTLHITADGLSEKSYYIQSVTVNGQAWDQSWISHKDLVGNNGSSIHFVLGPTPKSWDTGALPPSPGHVTL